MKTVKLTKMYTLIFIASIAMHIFFYISAHITHTLDIFYEHVTKGQDFFQIPNGAYAFLRGGTLQGVMPHGLPRFAECCGVNQNVYHPLFTLLVGVPLQLFKPWSAFTVWVFVHAVITFLTLLYFWKNFKHHPLLPMAASYFLLFSYHYYEIQHAQYHFLLNFFVLLFLYESQIKGDTINAGVLFFLTLLVKPIGFLWILPLLLYKRIKTVFLGLGLFGIVTLPFIVSPIGEYYYSNIKGVFGTQIPTYNLHALTLFYPTSATFIHQLGFVTAIFLLLFQIVKRPSLFKIISLWICYQLIFYSLVFHYHYTILAGVIALGLLLKEIKLSLFSAVIFVALMLPTPIVFLKLAGSPAILPPIEYSMIAIWSIFWLILFVISILNNSKHSITKLALDANE